MENGISNVVIEESPTSPQNNGKKNAKLEMQPEVENVRVFLRVRPLSKKESADNQQNIVLIDPDENLIALKKDATNNNASTKTFKFDQVFGEGSAQIALYRTIAAPIVEKALQGYNGTIFAYGQTGTGKTYTMAGEHNDLDRRGIIPNAFAHVFSKISQASGEKSFVVTATYLEIYNEKVRDLLGADPHKQLTIKERPDVGVYVKDLMGFTVDSVDSITELLNRGNRSRATRSTLMNDASSRSHAIFTITIESKNAHNNKTTVGKLNLVDLAGSERASRTQATGDSLREASNINLSLSVLGNVISALVDGKSNHIPYRNSKLTRLLQDSLGGNSKTAMIAMISPADVDYEESICTLRYAARVKHIKNYATINVEERGLIEGFELEIAELQQKLAQLGTDESRSKVVTQKKKTKIVNEVKAEELKKWGEEIEKTEQEKHELERKISMIQKKILVGGENLLEKAQHQAFLLESSGVELDNLDKTHQQLEETLSKKGQERIDVEEKYSSLQEEDAGVTKNIKTIQGFLNEFKAELSDKQHEYQRELETLLDSNRLLVRENQLADLMTDCYIPKEYLKTIATNMIFNDENREYQLRGVAYTGNNMRKRGIVTSGIQTPIKLAMKPVYHKYPERKERRSAFEKKMYSAAPKSR